jgi:thiol-disulfide isomerase/thioredoxin
MRILGRLSSTLVAAFATVFLVAAHAAPRLGPGDKLPEHLGVDRDGGAAESGKYLGKVVVVTFWASWCGPCRQELPRLDAIQRLAGKDKLQVVAINIEDRKRFLQVSSALSSLAVTITHDFGSEASETFGVHGIPHCVIVGRDGRIIAVHTGYDESQLDRILGEVNAALAAN